MDKQRPRFEQPEVAEKFASFPEDVRGKLLELRELIFETARSTPGVGAIVESLKWNEPSYATVRPKSGSPIRLGPHRKSDRVYALYFICTTKLVETFRLKFPHSLRYDGDRAIVFGIDDPVPEDELRECIRLALTYYLDGKDRR